ncbi:hypothetical protein FA09DRAFT_327642 [Tilletiopsis washingtonensis]|uniref:Uncharacterized protein n=1 Tax=Tilletiopsis washingtonensis TaxID=58919 RepID=A0A316ZGN4_9BASI|nr:hypothetical protein FA09DRAFT_327642 [Tilletiopsis washingtonensis]PWO00928.1 hypothetical protein FA09DRAFT_327642 [Tilletiopsis washingtonensis]
MGAKPKRADRSCEHSCRTAVKGSAGDECGAARRTLQRSGHSGSVARLARSAGLQEATARASRVADCLLAATWTERTPAACDAFEKRHP